MSKGTSISQISQSQTSQSVIQASTDWLCEMILTSRGKNDVSRQTETVCLDAAFLTPANALAKALSLRLKKKKYVEMCARFLLGDIRMQLTFACCNTKMLETELCTSRFSIAFSPKMWSRESEDWAG